MADNIFIEPVEQPKTAKRKTKKEMSAEEYERVCQRMTEMRENKKANLEKPKVAKPVKEKEVIKYVDRPVEVIREVIKEVVKEVPAKAQKTQAVDLFGDTDDLKAELKEMKALLADMARAKREKAEAKQARESSKPEAVKRQPEPEKPTEPAVKQPEPEKAKPQRVIYTGPMGMFRRV